MTSSRRQFIKAGVLGSAAAVAGAPRIAVADRHEFEALNILVRLCVGATP